MGRPPRLLAPGGTIHIVSRCNNREFFFQTADDFAILLAHLVEMCRTYTVTLYAYILLSNHLHLLLQAPTAQELNAPLGWLLVQTAKAFHEARGRRGHFWERRYRACLVEDDPNALLALRYLDRNPVRAGLVIDPVTYRWSSCATYATGAANPHLASDPSRSEPVRGRPPEAVPEAPRAQRRSSGRRPPPSLDDSAGRRQ
jgi:putative transposase